MADEPVRKVNIASVDWDDAVASIEVEDHDRLIDQTTVVLRDHIGAHHDVVAPGQRMKVELGWKGASSVLFEGTVQRCSSTNTGDQREQRVVAYDLSAQMHVAKPSRAVHGPGKLSEILTTMVNGHGIPVGEISADPDPQFKTLSQGPVTDLQFIQMLAVRYRARAFVEYNDGKSKFYFINEQKLARQSAKTRLNCCTGFQDVIDFQHERVASNALPYRVAAVINAADGTVADQPPPAPTTPTPPAASDERGRAADAGGMGDAYRNAVEAAIASTADPTIAPQLSAAGLPSDPDLADALSRPDPTQILGFRARATVRGNVGLRSKSKVNVTGVSSFIDGDWYVRIARHMVHDSTYQTALILTR